jgi:hypothetical protein
MGFQNQTFILTVEGVCGIKSIEFGILEHKEHPIFGEIGDLIKTRLYQSRKFPELRVPAYSPLQSRGFPTSRAKFDQRTRINVGIIKHLLPQQVRRMKY